MCWHSSHIDKLSAILKNRAFRCFSVVRAGDWRGRLRVINDSKNSGRLRRVLQPITLYFETTLFLLLFRLHYLAHALFLTPILPGKIDFNSAAELILYDRLLHTDSISHCYSAEKSIELLIFLSIICFNIYFLFYIYNI